MNMHSFVFTMYHRFQQRLSVKAAPLLVENGANFTHCNFVYLQTLVGLDDRFQSKYFTVMENSTAVKVEGLSRGQKAPQGLFFSSTSARLGPYTAVDPGGLQLHHDHSYLKFKTLQS